MLDRVIVQSVSCQQHSRSGLCAIVVRAYLIKLRNRLSRFIDIAQFEVSFREQVKILGLTGMFPDLFIQFSDIEFGAMLCRKLRPVVQVVEEMLIRHGPGRGVLRERLKDAQIALRCCCLMKAPLRHRKLVVAGGNIVANLHIVA